MKRALLLTLVISGALLYNTKSAQAEAVYQNEVSYTPLSGLCFKNDSGFVEGETSTECDGGTPDPGVFDDTTFFQEVTIENGTEISAVSLWAEATESNGANRAATFTAYLLNGSTKVATSTPLSWTYTDNNEIKFSFPSSYLVSTSTPVDGVAFEFDRNGAYPLFDTSKLNLRLTPNRYVGNTPSYYSGGYVSGLATGSWYSNIAQLSNWRDFAIIIYEDGDYVTITSPTNNETLSNSSLSLTGTCSNDVSVSVYNGTTLSNPGTFYGSTRVCTGNTWSWSLGTIDPGFWNVYVEVGEAHDGIVVLVRAQSPLGTGLPNFFATSTATSTLQNPFSSEEGSDAGYWQFIRGWGENIFSGRPFSYVIEIGNKLMSSFANAEPTNPFPTITLVTENGGATSTIQFETIEADDIYQLVPSSNWDSLRALGGSILAITFFIYLWYKVKNLL